MDGITLELHAAGGASTTWDGLGSAIVSGVLGGLVVLLGVWLAQILHDRSERKRTQSAAARQLLVTVSNLLDKVTSPRGRYTGRFELWPLRNELLSLRAALMGTEGYVRAEGLLSACAEYRRWLRADGGGWPVANWRDADHVENPMERDADEYLRVWSKEAGDVIGALQDPFRAHNGIPAPPQYPTLTWYADPRED